jgi:DNA-binding transcriptional LysR family regulator
MNWDDLRFVVEIGRAGTLAAAARRLKVDQTTVARRLRALEDELGAALFERDDGRWQPTAVGIDVLQRAGRIEEDVTALLRVAEAGAGAVSGLVRVTAVGTLIGDYLAPRLAGLYARHPDLSIELIASNDNLNVARREADIAIRLARPTRGDFLIRKLADSGFAVYGSANRGGEAENNWVAYLDDLAHTPEMQALESLRGDGRIRLRSGNIRGLMRAVATGIGCGILPCFLADSEPELRRLSGPQPLLSREIWLLVHPDARQQARVAAVADWLAECFANDAATFRGELQSPTRVST